MISTDINIKISVEDDVNLDNPKNTDKIKIDISHNNCGHEKMDNFADNLARIINYVIDSYQSLMKEGIQQQSMEPTGPIIEAKIKDQ